MYNVKLSSLDHVQQPGYVRYLLCFSTGDLDPEELLSRWRVVLDTLIKIYPFLAGYVVDDGLSHANSKELHFEPRVAADFDVIAKRIMRIRSHTIPYSDLKSRGFLPSELRGEDLHWFPVNLSPGKQQAFGVQANVFPEGGLILAMWWNHAYIDGTGAQRILAGLKDVLQALHSGTVNTLEPRLSCVGVQDFHGMVTQAHSKMSPETPEHGLIDVPGGDTSIEKHSNTKCAPNQSANVISRIFKFEIADIQRIHRPGGRRASPFRCALALLWTAINRVRFFRSQNESPVIQSRCLIIKDVREPLRAPADFLGNTVYGIHAVSPVLTIEHMTSDLADLPKYLTDILEEICNTIHTISAPRYMEERLAFLNEQSSVLGKRLEGLPKVLGQSDIDLACNSWESVGATCEAIPFQSSGLGRLDYVRRPFSAFPNSITALPRSRNSKYIEVDVCLEKEEMDGVLLQLEGWRSRGWLAETLA